METEFRAARAAGRKLLVPYITGGYPGWADAVRAAAANGADGIEIGIPFSDPVMDGPVIQRASQVALDGGATPPAILDEAAKLDVGIPLSVMTYYNLVHHDGHRRFAGRLVAAGIDACILPDLPLEEAGPWCEDADAAGIETVMLAAPTAPDDRLPRIVARARGFVYAVGLLGVTGERAVARRVGHRAGRQAQGDHRSARARRRRCVRRRAGGAGVRGRRRRRARSVRRAPVDGARAGRRRRVRRRGAGGDRRRAMSCELCEAARLTEWFHEDDDCWIAECESCSVPMVVWKIHDADPPVT